MHGDAKFRALTPPPPGGQALWWHLLAGEQTGVIPGLCCIGEAAFAEQLGWSLAGFRKAFHEVQAQGMAEADWKARLVWIPNALRYNTPRNPNIVAGWSATWDELPECPLKARAWLRMRSIIESLGEEYLKRFLESCPNHSGNYSPNDSVNGLPNQEKEKEQEKDQEKENPPAPGGAADSFAEFWSVYPRHEKKPKALAAWRKLNPDPQTVTVILAAIARQKLSPQWTKEAGQFIPHPATWINDRRWEDETPVKEKFADLRAFAAEEDHGD
jgi:hypothetical protein